MPSDYRLPPALSARLVGLCLVLTAVAVFVLTLVAALAGWSVLVVGLVAVVGLTASFVLGHRFARRPVVRLGAEGYRVRLVRGVGVAAAGWKDVEEAVTASPRGIDCVVLQLRDGRTTTIPVSAVDADPDQFVRDLRDHLQRGQGLRPLP